MALDVWTYRETSLGVEDLNKANVVGFGVEAIDGSIGKVDEATYDAGSAFIVVDTGPWIFGKKVMLPAGVVTSVDHDEETVFVNRTKDEIKNAPEFDDSLAQDEDYRGQLGTYYGPGGPGYRDWD
jgi:hypothetical protein